MVSFLYLFVVCYCEGAYLCHDMYIEIRGQFGRISSLLPSCKDCIPMLSHLVASASGHLVCPPSLLIVIFRGEF